MIYLTPVVVANAAFNPLVVIVIDVYLLLIVMPFYRLPLFERCDAYPVGAFATAVVI